MKRPPKPRIVKEQPEPPRQPRRAVSSAEINGVTAPNRSSAEAGELDHPDDAHFSMAAAPASARPAPGEPAGANPAGIPENATAPGGQPDRTNAEPAALPAARRVTASLSNKFQRLGGQLRNSFTHGGAALRRRFQGGAHAALPSSEMNEFERKRDEKKRAQRRKLALRIGIGSGALLVVLASIWLLFFSTVFAVTKVTVSFNGQGEVNEDWKKQTQALAERYKQQPVLNLPSDKIESEVKKLEFVSSATVEGQFPHTLKMAVELRQPAAVVVNGNTRIVVDPHGVPLKYLNPDSVQVPALAVELGTEKTGRCVDAGLRVLESLPEDIRKRVSYTSVSSPTNVQLFLDRGEVVKWGSRDESALKARVLQQLLQRPARVYDMTSPQAPVTSN